MQPAPSNRNSQTPLDEPVQKVGQGWYFRSTPTNMGFNPIQATVTITGRHLLIEPDRHGGTLLKNTLGSMGMLEPVAFPLRRISAVSIYHRKVWGKRDILRLEFDTGGREYVWLQPAPEWQAAILRAQPAAPELPFSTQPSVVNGVEASTAVSVAKVILVVAGVLVALTLLCVVLGVTL
jgi:hypothetical protein